MARTRSIIVALSAVAVLAAGCGDDGDDASGGDTTGAADGGSLEGLPQEVQDAAVQAEERDLLFMPDHDEIVACAEEEGEVVITTSSDEYQPIQEAFEAEYPFLSSEFVVLSGAATERFLLEVESGAAPNYDVGYPAPEAYTEITEMMGYDLAGMAEAGILDIPVDTIDQDFYTVASAGSSGVALAYNKALVSEDELPQTWEDLNDPKWGRDQLGMAMDVDLNNVSVLTVDPDWGTERVVELSEQLGDLEPVFTDGHTAAALLVQSGEVAISPFVNLHSAMREVDKDPDGDLQVTFIEPVPIRQSEASGVFRDADHPCTALLYIEWSAGDAAQEILDADPLQASFSWDGSRMAELIGDRETVIAEADDISKLPDAIAAIQEAFGFPSVGG